MSSFITLADQLEAKRTAACRIVDRFMPALLTKAFRGELVPQGRNEEAASMYFERIQADRHANAASLTPSCSEPREAPPTRNLILSVPLPLLPISSPTS